MIQLAVAGIVMVPSPSWPRGSACRMASMPSRRCLAHGRSLDRRRAAVLLAAAPREGGEATSFLYLVPSVTAIAAVPVLGQSLSAGAVAGLAFALVGVRMVSARRPAQPVRRAVRTLVRLSPGSAG